MSLTPEQIEKALWLRALDPPWGFDKIAAQMGITHSIGLRVRDRP